LPAARRPGQRRRDCQVKPLSCAPARLQSAGYRGSWRRAAGPAASRCVPRLLRVCCLPPVPAIALLQGRVQLCRRGLSTSRQDEEQTGTCIIPVTFESGWGGLSTQQWLLSCRLATTLLLPMLRALALPLCRASSYPRRCTWSRQSPSAWRTTCSRPPSSCGAHRCVAGLRRPAVAWASWAACTARNPLGFTDLHCSLHPWSGHCH